MIMSKDSYLRKLLHAVHDDLESQITNKPEQFHHPPRQSYTCQYCKHYMGTRKRTECPHCKRSLLTGLK